MLEAWERAMTSILDGNGHGEGFEEYMKTCPHDIEVEYPIIYIDEPRKYPDKRALYSHMILF